MAAITLDMLNYLNDAWEVDPNVLCELTDGLDVTFDANAVWGEHGGGQMLEFTGSREDLVTLITRYEEETETRDELIAEITG
jgi:hypothetical protein